MGVRPGSGMIERTPLSVKPNSSRIRGTEPDSRVSIRPSNPLAGTADPPSGRHSAFFAPLRALAGDRKTWSPALLAGVVSRAVANPGTYREVRRLVRDPLLAEATALNPRFPFKYLTHDYLVRDFNTRQRAACFLHHYRRLRDAFPGYVLRGILADQVPLYQTFAADTRFSITLGLSRPWDKEGELSLNLHVDGEIMFVLSFTIVPGWVTGTDAAEIVLISRIQGMKGCYGQISLATKSLFDVAPDSLLFAALQGFAKAFDIGEMAAVSATRQSSYCKQYDTTFRRNYDAFFTELGTPREPSGLFVSPIPVPEKPLTQIKQGHKLRTKQKRAFKAEVAAAVCELVRELSASERSLTTPPPILPLPLSAEPTQEFTHSVR